MTIQSLLKKISLTAMVVSGIFFSMTFAADTMCYTFDSGQMCLTIEKNNNQYELTRSYSGSPVIKCDIVTPSNNIYSMYDCDGTVAYYGDINNERMEIQVSHNTDFAIFGYDIEDDNLFILDNNNDIVVGETYYELSADTTREEDQQTTVSVRVKRGNTTLEDYDEDVDIIAQYRSSSSFNWNTITNSTSYISLSRKDINFDRNDDGRATFSFTPRKTGQYKITLEQEDNDDITGDIIIYVDDNNDNNNNYNDISFDLSVDTTREEDQQTTVSVTVKRGNTTYENYNEDVDIIAQYRSSSSSNWQTVTNSTSYISLSRKELDFDSNDNGRRTFSFTPRREGQYRIIIEQDNDDDITGNKIIYVGDNNNDNDDNDSSGDDFSITTDTTIPSDKVTGITIKAINSNNSIDENYDETVNFLMQYRSSTSSTRQTITTNSSYVSWSRSRSYTFSRSDDGVVELATLFTPQREGLYRFIVEQQGDEDVFESITINVDDSYTNSVVLGTNYILSSDTTVKTDEEVDLKITAREGTSTDDNYDKRVRLKVEYRSFSSSSRSSVTNSSSYIDLNTSSYTFSRFDEGVVTLDNIMSFEREGEYRVTVYQSDNSGIEKSIIFDVDDSNISSNLPDRDQNSSVSGFTRSQLSEISSMYRARPLVLSQLKSRYSAINSNATRKRDSEYMYADMYDILYGNTSTRRWSNYNEYRADLISWASSTARLMR